jgi:hypothetical protein
MAEGIPPKMVWGRKLSLDKEEQEPEQPIVRFAEIMEEQEHQVASKSKFVLENNPTNLG